MSKFTLTLTALTFAASAATADDPVFRWAPDDLATLQGVTATHQRVQDTAKAYCKDYLRGTRGISRMARCIDRLADEIVEQVADPRLTAYAQNGTVDEKLLAAVAAKRSRS